jgi:hypothetical protein
VVEVDRGKYQGNRFKTLLSDLFPIPNKITRSVMLVICGFTEGAQVIFLRTCVGSCMVELKSGRARTMLGYLFPYRLHEILLPR